MAWTYSPESQEFPLLSRLGCDLSRTVKSTPTAAPFCFREWPREGCRPPPSGTTFGLFAEPCCQPSTLSTAGSPARTSALQAAAQAWRESAAVFSSRYSGLSANAARPSSFWKMSRPLGPVAENEWSKNWPRSGMTVDGTCYPLTTWERRTKENAGSCWPTPVADDSVNRVQGKWNSRGEPKLSAAVMLFPPPTTNVGGCSGAVQMWATPTTRNTVRSSVFQDGRTLSPREQTGGMLNPTWVEWLMAYPLGWTVCEPWAMPSSRSKREKPSPG